MELPSPLGLIQIANSFAPKNFRGQNIECFA
jgi:hypothetical protein